MTIHSRKTDHRLEGSLVNRTVRDQRVNDMIDDVRRDDGLVVRRQQQQQQQLGLTISDGAVRADTMQYEQ